MNKNLVNSYEEVINKIIKDDKTEAIFLIGSSKNKNFNKDKIKDIDLFVFSKIQENQTRELIEIDETVFDISYFSKKGIEKLIEDKEYFFIKEMRNPQVVFNKDNEYQTLIDLCKNLYDNGPGEISDSQKELLKTNLKDKVETLKNVNNDRESIFLTNLYLKDIISGYFIINNKWIPKDKKIFDTLNKENKKLYNLILENTDNSYEYLIKILNYVF